MPGPRNDFEQHLIDLADGDLEFLGAASEMLGYQLEEPPARPDCPRCGRRGLDEDEERAMVRSAVCEDDICLDCQVAEEHDMLHGRQLAARTAWPVRPWPEQWWLGPVTSTG